MLRRLHIHYWVAVVGFLVWLSHMKCTAMLPTINLKTFMKFVSLLIVIVYLTFLVINVRREGCLERPKPDKIHLFKHDMREIQACSAVIKGDLDGIDRKYFSELLGTKKRTSLLSENFYLNATSDCQAYIRDRGFLTAHLSKEEKDFPVAYSMVIHEKIEMFERLLRAIYTPQNVYCVHVDQKSPKSFIEAVKSVVSCFPNVFLASKMVSVVYASWSRVQADINCMEDLLKSPVKWKYLLNTCGSDFPIKTNAEIVQTLKYLDGRNSLESEHTNYNKKLRWVYHHNVTTTVIRTSIKKTPPPIETPMFTGSAYFVVTREFVEYFFKSPEIWNFIEWEKDTYSPDEHLWATLQRWPAVPGSKPVNERYDESDMLAIARLVKWGYLEGNFNKGAPYSPCTGQYRHDVCVFGTGELQWIVRQKHLFANKFDPMVDDIAIRCMEVFLWYKAIHGQSLLTIDTTLIT